MVHAVGNDATIGPDKVFTPKAATGMLPLVRRIVTDIVGLNGLIQAQREQLKGLDSIAQTSDRASFQDELADMRTSLCKDELALEDCIGELSALGVTMHRPIDGGVDFPAEMNRRPIQLCWHLGEESVCHWHESQRETNALPVKRHKIDPANFGSSVMDVKTRH